MAKYAGKQAWEARKNKLQRQILGAAGLLPMPAKPALHPVVAKRTYAGDYSVEAVLIETLPGYRLGGDLYRPVGAAGRRPAILAPHGHWKHGRLEDLPEYSVPALCINLARQGYVVFAYDMAGYNDTRQTPHSFHDKLYTLWSFSPLGLQLWNSIRALDYLQSLPDVDGKRIGITGASGGGTQTFLLTAVDERVKAAAPVNMVSAYMQGGDPCEEAPNLRVETSNVEIAAMAAPRPLLIVSSTHDWTRHTPEEEFPEIRAIYELYGRGRSVTNVHVDAQHNFNRQSREAVYRFFAAELQTGLKPEEVSEREFTVPAEEDLLALPRGHAPEGSEGLAAVFQAWKAAGTMSPAPGLQQRREALLAVLNTEWPAMVDSSVHGHTVAIGRAGRGDIVTGYWRPGEGDPVLIVHAQGSAAALQTPMAQEALQSGRPVLAIEPFLSGAERGERAELDAYFYSYQRSDDAERVQDILTALAFLKFNGDGPTHLVCSGDAGVRCLFAAAVAPVRVDLLLDLIRFGGSDEDYLAHFFVPGIQRAGGLDAAMELVTHFPAAAEGDDNLTQ